MAEGARDTSAALYTLSTLGIFFLLANLLDFPFGRDQGIFVVVADTFFHGGAPYKDAWDFKTPGIYMIFAVSRVFFGSSEIGFRVFESLMWIGMGVGFFSMTAGRFSYGAATLGLFFSIFSMMMNGFWHVGQPETFGAVLIIWAIAICHMRPSSSASLVRWAAVAALYAAAAFLKPTMGVGALVSYSWVSIAIYRERGWLRIWHPTAGFTLGGLAMLVALLFWLHSSGAMPGFREALFNYAPKYTALGHIEESISALTLDAISKFTLVWPFLPLGIALLFAIEHRNMNVLIVACHISCVILALLFTIGLQAKFFFYHYGTVVALSGLLAGWGYWSAWEKIKNIRAAKYGYIALLGASLFSSQQAQEFWKGNVFRAISLTHPERRFEIDAKIYSVNTFDIISTREISNWIKSNKPTPASQPTLFIWGFEPSIYYYSDTTPHNRFIYNAPLRAEWSREAAFSELWRSLNNRRPWAIVLQDNDRLPRVNGDPRDSTTVLDEDLPDFSSMLEREYILGGSFGPFKIYTNLDPMITE